MTRFAGVKKWLKLVLIPLAGLLFACGGGGSSEPGSTDTTISGSVVAAPVSGASVLVKDSAGNTVAGPVTTGSDGGYSVNIPNSSLSGVLIFESTGGTYTDEATSLGGVLSVLIKHKLAAVYMGNGQRVPDDFHPLTAKSLIAEMRELAGRIQSAQSDEVWMQALGVMEAATHVHAHV